MTIGNGKVRHLVKPTRNTTKAELLGKLDELETQLHQLQELTDHRYGQVKWKLDGIQQQLSTATLWAKEAAKNAYNTPPHRVWLILSLTLNVLLIGSLVAKGNGG